MHRLSVLASIVHAPLGTVASVPVIALRIVLALALVCIRHALPRRLAEKAAIRATATSVRRIALSLGLLALNRCPSLTLVVDATLSAIASVPVIAL